MNIAELVINVHNNTLSPIRKIAKKYSLSDSQLICIATIPSNGISQSELAKLLSIDLSTLSRNLSRLIKMKVLIKSNDPYDNRAYQIALTEHGETLYKKILKSLEKYLEVDIAVLDADEHELMLDNISNFNWLLLKKKSNSASV